MSAGLEWTDAALADLRAIWYYVGIRNCNPAAADRLCQDIRRAGKELAQNPSLGHVRRDLTQAPGVFFYRVRENYLIVYQRDAEPLRIARVSHAARDVKSELEAE